MVVGVLQEQQLPLIKVLHALLTPHQFDHRGESLLRDFGSKQVPPAVLEQEGDVVDVGAVEVVQANFEHV